jgi:hypothetical protein
MERQLAGAQRSSSGPPQTSAAQRTEIADPRAFVDGIYDEVKRRLVEEAPHLLEVVKVKPELRVQVKRERIEAKDDTLFGRLAVLVAEGFFDEGATGNAAFNELERRGRGSAKPNVYRECDKLAALGFLTKEANGYKAVQGMKVHIDEAAA